MMVARVKSLPGVPPPTPRAKPVRKRGGGHQPSALARELIEQVRLAGLEAPAPECRFCARCWRLDLAWPRRTPPVAVEIQGGTWTRGAHVRGRGVERDCVKLNEAVLAGYRVLLVTTDMVRDGRALQYVRRALGGQP